MKDEAFLKNNAVKYLGLGYDKTKPKGLDGITTRAIEVDEKDILVIPAKDLYRLDEASDRKEIDSNFESALKIGLSKLSLWHRCRGRKKNKRKYRIKRK